MLNEVKHLDVAERSFALLRMTVPRMTGSGMKKPRRPRHVERSEASLRCGEILRFAQDDDAEDDGVRDDEAEAASSC